jgi:hypothetical protein
VAVQGRASLARPLRLASLIAAGVAGLSAFGSLAVPGADPAVFAAAGLVYGAFLALFVTGLILAARWRALQLLSLAALLPLLGMAGLSVCLALAPEPTFALLPALCGGLLGIIGVWLGAGTCLAVTGWVSYARRRCSASRG